MFGGAVHSCFVRYPVFHSFRLDQRIMARPNTSWPGIAISFALPHIPLKQLQALATMYFPRFHEILVTQDPGWRHGFSRTLSGSLECTQLYYYDVLHSPVPTDRYRIVPIPWSLHSQQGNGERGVPLVHASPSCSSFANCIISVIILFNGFQCGEGQRV